jgi:hypothetical protein
MAGHAGDVAVATQDRIEGEGLAQPNQARANRRRPLQGRDSSARSQLPNLGG